MISEIAYRWIRECNESYLDKRVHQDYKIEVKCEFERESSLTILVQSLGNKSRKFSIHWKDGRLKKGNYSGDERVPSLKMNS